MTYETIQTKIIRTIRGQQSQVYLSKMLGFKSNRVHKWENCQRQIKWRDFVNLCERQNYPIEKIIRFCLKFVYEKFDPYSAAQILSKFLSLYGLKNTKVLARRLHVHPSVVQRWLSGKVDPDLQSMLRIFDLANNFLDLFVTKIISSDSLDQKQFENLSLDEFQLHFFSYFPWALAINSALQTKEFFNFSDKKIPHLSKFLEVDENLIKLTIRLMLEAKILKKTHGVCYEVTHNNYNFSNLATMDTVRPIQYWSEKIQKKIKLNLANEVNESQKKCYFSDFRVLALSPVEFDKLNQIIVDFVGKLSSLNSEKTIKEDVSCIVLHHFHPGIVSSKIKFEEFWLDHYCQTLPEFLKKWIHLTNLKFDPHSSSPV
ncbi:MAG: helix-turn-helix transcriptional regulator [Bdellovibrionales bacterium]|nr:helix-turn-helix transcriptional regulator [Bdellovibrionales bacterium]